MKEIVNRIENCLALLEIDNSKKSRKSLFKSIDHISIQNSGTNSPRRKTKNLKQMNVETKISNYQKYIKNVS